MRGWCDDPVPADRREAEDAEQQERDVARQTPDDQNGELIY